MYGHRAGKGVTEAELKIASRLRQRGTAQTRWPSRRLRASYDREVSLRERAPRLTIAS